MSKESAQPDDNGTGKTAGASVRDQPRPQSPSAKSRHAKPAATQTEQQETFDGSRGTAQSAADQSEAPDDHEGLVRRNSFLFLTAVPSWLASMVVHTIALLILALVTIPESRPQFLNELTVGEATETTEELDDFAAEDIEPINVEALEPDDIVPQIDTDLTVDDPVITPANDPDSARLHMELSPFGEEFAPRSDLLTKVGSLTGTGLEGRGTAAQSALVKQGGGTKASQQAVAAALRWFAAHQNSDGSWNLDHRFGPCQGRCGDPGSRRDAPNGATALALLPFLGAGQTHLEGEYKKTVGAGLDYLLQSMRIVGQRGSLFDEGGNYYSHGLGAIVLCEAYAMTEDKSLMKAAQMAIYETAYAQDPVGGGWRYRPQDRGDTSALGWQLMALKSAHMAYLHVPPETYKRASKFLDSVQTESGAKYGYLDPGAGSATTAVGLLCRMYLGWRRDVPALERGVDFLRTKGPSEHNMYYNYYGTQVMRHYGGDVWKAWNEAMRDYLVNTQARTGHEKGSWFFGRRSHSSIAGGRLYATSMATMILEVYYRYMPIYKQEAAEEDFPL